jgi:hypothetical protein
MGASSVDYTEDSIQTKIIEVVVHESSQTTIKEVPLLL